MQRGGAACAKGKKKGAGEDEARTSGGGRRASANGGVPRASARQMARVANERLKLLLPLREASNMTANKGGACHRRIPAVAQLSPKISQTHGALPLPLQSAAFAVILQEEALLGNISRRLFRH